MSERRRREDSPCVVAVVPQRRWGGHVAIGSDGIIPGSWCSWNLRGEKDHAAAVERWLAASIERHLPNLVVVGRVGRDASQGALVHAAMTAAKAAGVPVVELRVEDARRVLLTHPRRRKGDTLAALLVTAFFPALGEDLARGIEHFRYRRHAWNAIALALVELARRWPGLSARLHQPGAPAMPLLAGLERRANAGNHPPADLPIAHSV